MAKKNVKSFKKVEKKKIVEAAKPTINELIIEACEKAVDEHGFEGIIIVGLREGAYVPYALAKTIPDLLTLKHVLDREINRLIDGTFNNKPQE